MCKTDIGRDCLDIINGVVLVRSDQKYNFVNVELYDFIEMILLKKKKLFKVQIYV